jgi:hypothetical protein
MAFGMLWAYKKGIVEINFIDTEKETLAVCGAIVGKECVDKLKSADSSQLTGHQSFSHS